MDLQFQPACRNGSGRRLWHQPPKRADLAGSRVNLLKKAASDRTIQSSDETAARLGIEQVEQDAHRAVGPQDGEDVPGHWAVVPQASKPWSTGASVELLWGHALGGAGWHNSCTESFQKQFNRYKKPNESCADQQSGRYLVPSGKGSWR
jgi:hypothetical protein